LQEIFSIFFRGSAAESIPGLKPHPYLVVLHRAKARCFYPFDFGRSLRLGKSFLLTMSGMTQKPMIVGDFVEKAQKDDLT
jgi:hypothetical protein